MRRIIHAVILVVVAATTSAAVWLLLERSHPHRHGFTCGRFRTVLTETEDYCVDAEGRRQGWGTRHTGDGDVRVLRFYVDNQLAGPALRFYGVTNQPPELGEAWVYRAGAVVGSRVAWVGDEVASVVKPTDARLPGELAPSCEFNVDGRGTMSVGFTGATGFDGTWLLLKPGSATAEAVAYRDDGTSTDLIPVTLPTAR